MSDYFTERSFEPDPDASELDKLLLEFAARLHGADMTTEAMALAASAATLRETPGNPGDLAEALHLIREAAGDAAKLVERGQVDLERIKSGLGPGNWAEWD
ncbi:hypothetical protein [Plantactinospora sp. WMMB782]|uniref:hypothetical protein n=1 Tax=Plantactinospora sp. WMMB782 TaxID=3404121 RepID=UPI003B957289